MVRTRSQAKAIEERDRKREQEVHRLAPKLTPFGGVDADSGEPVAGAEPVSVQPVDIEAEVGSALPNTGNSDEGKLSEIGRDQLIQKQDPTLAPVRAKVALRPPKEKTGFFLDAGVIQRRCFSTKSGGEPSYVDQLVVPQQCRDQLLELAHDIPLAGHMGIDNTAESTSSLFLAQRV